MLSRVAFWKSNMVSWFQLLKILIPWESMVEYQTNTSAVGPLGSVFNPAVVAPGSSSEVLRGQKLGGGHEVSERGHPAAPRRTPAQKKQSAVTDYAPECLMNNDIRWYIYIYNIYIYICDIRISIWWHDILTYPRLPNTSGDVGIFSHRLLESVESRDKIAVRAFLGHG